MGRKDIDNIEPEHRFHFDPKVDEILGKDEGWTTEPGNKLFTLDGKVFTFATIDNETMITEGKQRKVTMKFEGRNNGKK